MSALQAAEAHGLMCASPSQEVDDLSGTLPLPTAITPANTSRG